MILIFLTHAIAETVLSGLWDLDISASLGSTTGNVAEVGPGGVSAETTIKHYNFPGDLYC